MSHIKTVRRALNHVFGHRVSPQQVEDATFTGREDPGGWARRAHVVIHTETGIPPLTSSVPGFERVAAQWDRVGDILQEHGLYCEPVNSAVVAVYDC